MEELRVILGALHDTKCGLENHNADPTTTEIQYADFTNEVERIVALELRLQSYLPISSTGITNEQ